MSEHWYKKDGTPQYTVIGKNGKERNTTLADARKLNLVPSVSGIIRQAREEALDRWKIRQAILAALTLPRVEGEPDEKLIDRIEKDAQEQAEKAAQKGTEIHDRIEQGFKGINIKDPFFTSAFETISFACGVQDWTTEHSFATDYYGGKIDLHNDKYLLDIKTTDKDISKLKLWDSHFMQLAAYDYGIGQGGPVCGCGIIFVNSITAESRLVWVTPKQMNTGLTCFMALLNYFYAKTGLGRE